MDVGAGVGGYVARGAGMRVSVPWRSLPEDRMLRGKSADSECRQAARLASWGCKERDLHCWLNWRDG
eukprot:4558446-Prorocentrum_lima.AAC.1